MLNRVGVEAIQGRVAATTEGTWRTFKDEARGSGRYAWNITFADEVDDRLIDADYDEPSGFLREANAEFTANAHQDVPALLDLVRRMDRLVEDLADLNCWCLPDAGPCGACRAAAFLSEYEGVS